MRMILVTTFEKPIYVNPDHVVKISTRIGDRPEDDMTIISLADGSQFGTPLSRDEAAMVLRELK